MLEMCLFLVGPVIVDQSIRRRIVTRNIRIPLQLWQNLLRQRFTQLNTPLIERIDIPDGPLSEDLHFVQGNQNAKHAGCQLLEEHGGRGSVSLKHLVGHQGLDLLVTHLAARLELRTDRIGILSEGHGLGLGKVVGKEDGVMIYWGLEVLGDIVVCFNGRQEIAGDHLCSLMNELIKRVLSIRSWLSPNDGTRLDIASLAIFGNVLSITFHISLLEVRRESVHVLIVGEDGQGFRLMKVIVPESDQRQGQRQVILGIGIQKVLIHGMRSRVHLHPVIESEAKRNWRTNGRPEGVATSHPIPKSEHVVGINTEGRHGGGIGGKGGKVLGHAALLSLVIIQQPLLGRSGICHGLLRREGLGRNEEEGALGIALLENFGNVCPVDIGAEEHFEVTFGVWLESLRDHDGSEVGSANTNVDYGVDGLASVSLPRSIADVFGKGLDLGEDLVDLRHDILSIDVDGSVGLIPQRDVEDGAALGVVDFLSREHFLGLSHDIGFGGELVE
mmetsp:Transcript_9105/g.15829  ORF Transcript_9105/g.15829 Transcript_9105/m.15829 type:complete len:501 (-) Transcript_9105:206-1708(-)